MFVVINPKCSKNTFSLLQQRCELHLPTKNTKGKEKRPVIWTNAEKIVEYVLEKQNFVDNYTIKVMADGGQGFFKVCFSIVPVTPEPDEDLDVNVPTKKRKLSRKVRASNPETSVKKLETIENIRKLIKELHKALLATRVSETLKIHVLLQHIYQCLEQIDLKQGLGLWFERDSESAYREFLKFWERRKVNLITHVSYPQKLKKATVKFSSLHV